MDVSERLIFYPKQVSYLTEIVQAAHRFISEVCESYPNTTFSGNKSAYDEAWKKYQEWLESYPQK